MFAYISLADDKRSIIFDLLINLHLLICANFLPNSIIKWVSAIPCWYLVLTDTLKHSLDLTFVALYANEFRILGSFGFK